MMYQPRQPSLVALDGKTPPQNVDAELDILGGILIDPEAIERVIGILTPEMFYFSAHQEIYRVAVNLHVEGIPVDLMTVVTRLSDRKLLEKIGGQNKIADLIESVVSAVNIDQYALLVQEKYLRRQLIKVGAELTQLGYDGSTSINTAIDQAEQNVFQIGNASTDEGLVLVSETIHRTFEDIEARSTGAVQPGISCGFYDLDAMTQGFQRQDLIIVAGRPSMGKTSIALNIARNISVTHKLPVAVFSLEMSKEQLNYRLTAAESGISMSALRAGRVNENQWSTVGQGVALIANTLIGVDDTSTVTTAMIRSRARKFAARMGGVLGAIVIDYLQLMGNSEDSGDGNRVQELSRITRSLKGLARELNVPVFVLSQLSRGVESRTNKRPMMSDLRESGAIEQDADLILMLYRDEYYHPDTPDKGIAEVIISKHRNGPVGTTKLLFEPEFCRFRNLARRAA